MKKVLSVLLITMFATSAFADALDKTKVAAAASYVDSAFNALDSAKQDALTTAQQNAVDSGITAGKVSTYDGYATTIAGKQDALTTAQQNAVDSGITAAKVSTYDGYATTKQNTIDSTHKLSADFVEDGTTNKVVTAAEKTAWDAKLSTVTVDNTGVSTGNPAPVVTNVSASNGTITVTRQDLTVPVKNQQGNYEATGAAIWFE